MTPAVLLSVLGDLVATRDGQPVRLRPSRKTRALLAYLALTARAHRRERLCEMFWDLPDDPSGSLRWSLSKLRGIVDVPGAPRIIADQERVALDLTDGMLDLDRARSDLGQEVPGGGLVSVICAAGPGILSQPVLGRLDMPQSEAWQNWLFGLRAEGASLWTKALTQLLAHPDCADHDVLQGANAWLCCQTRRHPGRHGRWSNSCAGPV